MGLAVIAGALVYVVLLFAFRALTPAEIKGALKRSPRKASP